MIKKFLTILFAILFLLPCSVFAATNTTGSEKARDANADEAMLYTYLRYGMPVPDSLIKSLGFRGTGFAATPSNFEEIVNAIAAQWIFGVEPTKGVTNYSSDMVTEGQNNNVYSDREARLYKSIGPAAMGAIPTQAEQPQSSDPNEQGKITQLDGGVAQIALSDINSTGMFVKLMAAALGRAENLSETAPNLHGMLPEQEKTRQIGGTSNTTSNSGINGGTTRGASTSRLLGNGGTVLGDSNTALENQSPFEVAKGAKISVTASEKDKMAATLIEVPYWLAANNPAANADAPANMTLPPVAAGARSQMKITSPGMAGNGGANGRSSEISGYTSKLPGTTLGDLNDAMNLALQNASDQINNRYNQLNNAQNQFPDGRLNQLQNQFSPDDFNNQLGNRFPDSGGNGGNGGGSPTAQPTTSNTTECDPTKATLSQQEAVDVADFLGLPISNDWTVSYFKAQQMIGQSLYLGNNTSQTTIDNNIITDPQACVWVTYAPTVKEGVFVSDVRSASGLKFMFRIP